MTHDHSAGPLAADAGTVFCFRTSRGYPAGTKPPRHYGTFKVLSVTDETVFLGVLGGVWELPPQLSEIAAAGLQRERRFAHRGTPAVFGLVDPRAAVDLAELAMLGTVPLTEEERRLAAEFADRSTMGRRFSNAEKVDIVVEGEWRWEHDRDAFEAEYHARREEEEERREAKAEYLRTRLKGLTWEQLLTEDPFAHWEPSPPYLPAAFRIAATARAHDTCRAVQSLGPKPRRVEVRRELKELVAWIKAAVEHAGGVVQTREREDVSRLILDIAHVARQPALADEAAAWWSA